MKFSLIERLFAVLGAVATGFVLVTVTAGVVNMARPLLINSKCGSPSPCAAYTNTGKGPGIQGNNTNAAGQANGFGVLGTSTSTDGVHGTSTHAGSSGVAGIMAGTTSNNGNGVYGQSSDASGKYAALYAAGYNSATYLFQGYNFSTGNNCKIDPNANLSCTGKVSGTGNNSAYAVEGTLSGDGGSAVTGIANGTEDGVLAQSADSTGNFDALAAYGTNAATYLFSALNEANSTNCFIDPKANLVCSGTISGAAVGVRQRTATHRPVLAYASESATATIEDVGTARMVEGVANVRIPADFLSAINRENMYYVFLTPLGDTRGLYVSFKGSAGFQVREAERGRSSIDFDYRIVAHPFAAGNDRLPPAPAAHLPKVPPARR
jgi:hypothetical protein